MLKKITRSPFFWLFLIVLVGLAVRLILFTGQIRGDDYYYAKSAFELTQGRTHFGVWSFGTSRVGLYAPTALLYMAFGVSPLSTAGFPLLTSLGTIVLVYLLATLYAPSKAGLISAMLWAVFPLDIFLATDLMPDTPTAFFYTGILYFFLRAYRAAQLRERLLWSLGAFVCLIWGFYVKPTIIAAPLAIGIFLGIQLAHWVYQRFLANKIEVRSIFKAFLFVVALLLLALILFSGTLPIKLARAGTDFSMLLTIGKTNIHSSGYIVTYTPLFLLFGPLFLISVFHLLTSPTKHPNDLLALTLIGFAYFEWGSFETNIFKYNPLWDWGEARYLLYLLPGLVALTGLYLTRFVQEDLLPRLILVWAPLIVALSIIMSDPGSEPLGNRLSETAVVLALMGMLASLLWKPSKSRPQVNPWLGAGLILLINLAAMAPVQPSDWRFFAPRLAMLANLQEATHNFDIEGDGFVFTDQPNMQLEFSLDFALSVNWRNQFPADPDGRLRLVTSTSDLVLPANSLLFLFNPDNQPPGNAELISQHYFEEQLLFRVYGPLDAE